MKRFARWLGFALLAAGLLAGLLVATLPVSNTVWVQVLGVSGEVQVAAWSPTPTATATATDIAPAETGTSIEAFLTAEGYLEGGAAGVRGRICVANVGDWPTEGLALHDVVEYKTGGGPFVALPGAELIIAPELPLPAGEHACSDYQIPFKPVPDAQYRNTVRVTILNHSGWMPGGPHCAGPAPCPFGPEPKADFELAPAPVDEIELATDLPAPSLTAPPHPTVRRATATPAPTETATPSPEPTATETPTGTPTPTPTLVPTETEMPSMETPTPELRPTETPILPPTKTPELPPTKTPILPPTKTPLPP